VIADRGNLRIVVFHPGLTPSTHIRLLAPLRHLVERNLITLTIFNEADVVARAGLFAPLGEARRRSRERRLTADAAIRQADMVIIQRSTSPAGLQILARARAAHTKVIYECDDDFLAIDEGTPSVGEYYNRPPVRRAFKTLLTQADLVTTSTAVLAESFGRLARVVRTLPNCVDLEYAPSLPKAEASGPMVIGYAGTVTHTPDFICVVPALRRMLHAQRGALRLQFFGFIPEMFKSRDDVDFVSYEQDYPAFMRVLGRARWTVGIAPLANHPANRGKTDNKYREYGASWIPGLYSRVPAYEKSVTHGQTGLLVPHSEEGWYAGLVTLLKNSRLRADIARAARGDVTERYSVRESADAWLATFKSLGTR
jgi:glycosyltransferase involved in cell wall biosynthesis